MRQVNAPITVAILSGDPIIAQVLELLLQGADYRTRLVTEIPSNDPSGYLDEAQILLLVPGLNPRLRGAVLSTIGSTTATVKMPILELVTAFQSGQGRQEHHVPWPCRTEELKRRIENALLARRDHTGC